MLRRAFLGGALPPLAAIGAPLVHLTAAAGDATGIRNVREFGAAGNGTTDDSAAIQRAIDDGGRGGSVFFPQGRYLVGAPIVPRDDTVLLAHGRHTLLVSATPGRAVILATGVKRVFLDGLYIHGQRSQRDGIVIDHCDDVRIRACWVTATGGNGIAITAAPCMLIDSTIELTGGDGVVVADANSGVPLHMIGCYVYANAANGVHFHHNGNQAMVIGCEIIQNGGAGVLIADKSEYLTLTSNVIQTSLGAGVEISGSRFTTLNSNVIMENGANGVLVEDGSDYTTVLGNRCISNGRQDPDRYGEVAVHNSRDVTLLANVLADFHARPGRAPLIERDAASTVTESSNVERPDRSP